MMAHLLICQDLPLKIVILRETIVKLPESSLRNVTSLNGKSAIYFDDLLVFCKVFLLKVGNFHTAMVNYPAGIPMYPSK